MNVVSTNEAPGYINLEDLQLETQPSFDAKTMRQQEEAIRTELFYMGITSGPWRTGESDSFGILSRVMTIELSEDYFVEVVYA